MKQHLAADGYDGIRTGIGRGGTQPDRRGNETARDAGRTTGQVEKGVIIRLIQARAGEKDADTRAAAVQNTACTIQKNLVIAAAYAAGAQIKIRLGPEIAGEIAADGGGRAANAGLRFAAH